MRKCSSHSFRTAALASFMVLSSLSDHSMEGPGSVPTTAGFVVGRWNSDLNFVLQSEQKNSSPLVRLVECRCGVGMTFSFTYSQLSQNPDLAQNALSKGFERNRFP